MKKLTYKEAYDKIIHAYFKDEIKPMDSKFCFCGTLSPNPNWAFQRGESEYFPYSTEDYEKMEIALLGGLKNIGVVRFCRFGWKVIDRENGIKLENRPQYEDCLFSGMCAALDVLKQIHIKRGENVDEVPVFEKRKLKAV